jgi:hypothetical protein
MARPATYTTAKTTDFRSIDLAWLRRKGARNVGYSGTLRWSRGGTEIASIGYCVEPDGLRLHYRTTPRSGLPEVINELVPIVTTEASKHLGGVRHWFRCPSCRRRCRILYGGARFRCRLCRMARYESQYQHAALTVCDLRWRLRERLEERGGWKADFLGLDDGFPPRPKWMRKQAYKRLEARDNRLARRWVLGVSDWLESRK